MSTLKIAHVTTIDLSIRSLLLNQLLSLHAAGYEAAGISAPGPDVPAIEAAGVRHIAVPMSRNLTPFADLASLWRLYRIMRRERFAIVHTHTPKAGLLGQLAARLAGVPLVVNTIHGFYFHEHMRPAARRFYIAMEKLAALCSHAILSQNREDIRTGLDEGIFPERKVRHLGNGIDLSLFDPGAVSAERLASLRAELRIPDGAKVVGFVGRLAARRKGFLDFLAAGREVLRRQPGVRFVIVGESDHGKPDAVEPSAAEEFGIAEACRFLGRRENEELPAIFRLMDVLVLPSLFEGVPRVIMEAAAMGVPAVASDVKGNREAVADGRTGVLTPLGDVDSLARAILGILGDETRARAMGDAARAMALDQFDERKVFATVKEEYARLLDARRLAAPAGCEARQPVPACDAIDERSPLRRIYGAILQQSAFRKAVMTTPLIRDLAWRFVAGENLDAGMAAVRALNASGIQGTVNYVGTHVRSRPEAIAAADAAIAALQRISDERLASHLSLKLTQIGLDIDDAFCRQQLRRVLDRAHALGSFVRIDMEESPYVERTLEMFEEALDRYGAETVGIVIQSYLRHRTGDLDRVLARGASVRLVKGGYWEAADIVHRDKAEIDRCFERDLTLLLARGRRPAIATHDARFIARACELAEQAGLGRGEFEFQMLYGVRRDLQERLVREGRSVRCYVPYGGQWLSHFMGCVRRLPGGGLRRVGEWLAPAPRPVAASTSLR